MIKTYIHFLSVNAITESHSRRLLRPALSKPGVSKAYARDEWAAVKNSRRSWGTRLSTRFRHTPHRTYIHKCKSEHPCSPAAGRGHNTRNWGEVPASWLTLCQSVCALRATPDTLRPLGRSVVRSRGLEPPRVSPLPPQGSASTNSATTARHLRMRWGITGQLPESNPCLNSP